MRCRWSAGVGAFGLGLVIAVHPASAETAALRIARPVDLVALPLIVMQHEHLIERVAEQMGLGAVKIDWVNPGKTGPIEALAGGQAELAATDIVSLVIAADNTAGTPGEVRALAALTERPYVLVARKAGVNTIRDFRAGDHIAVPALKISGPALMLEMAAAQEWGVEHYDKLDPLLVARPDEAASEALQSGKGNLDAHFSQAPYADDELVNAAIHRVMDSFDIAGPHSVGALVATAKFRDANPLLCAAVAWTAYMLSNSVPFWPESVVKTGSGLRR